MPLFHTSAFACRCIVSEVWSMTTFYLSKSYRLENNHITAITTLHSICYFRSVIDVFAVMKWSFQYRLIARKYLILLLHCLFVLIVFQKAYRHLTAERTREEESVKIVAGEAMAQRLVPRQTPVWPTSPTLLTTVRTTGQAVVMEAHQEDIVVAL